MIVVKHGQNAAHMAQAAMAEIWADEALGRTILLKPNVGRVSTPGTGVCTNPEVVRGLIRFFKHQGAGTILVGDGPIWGVDIHEALEKTGMRAVCEQEGAQCVDMDSFGSIDLPIPGGHVVDTLRFSALIRQVDCIVSVPVMKTHMYTGATLSIKNMKGCLYKMEKTKLHRINRPVPDARLGRVLDYGIADMATVLLPHYAVIDGTVGMEGLGPSVGSPRELRVVVASANALAADFAALRLMGMDVDAVPHLNLIRAALQPELDPLTMAVTPPDFMRHAQPFAPASMQQLSNEYPHIRVVERGACSACSAALMVFLRTHGHRFDPALHMTLATGKDLHPEDVQPTCPSTPDTVFFIGNCAAECAATCAAPAAEGVPARTYCKGCPPIGSSILEHMRMQGSPCLREPA